MQKNHKEISIKENKKPMSDEKNADNLVPTLSQEGKRKWIYPERRGGYYADFRRRIANVLMLIYLVVPWLTLNDLPLLRIDLIDKRIYFFGQMLRFNEASYVAFLFIILAMALFFVTSLKGRIWCGYACPQTVFIEWLIRAIEEKIEGKAFQRRVLDSQKISLKKVSKKFLKHVIFFAIAIGIANVFLAYFIDPKRLLQWVSSSPLHHPYGFSIMLTVSIVLYLDFAWFREQFCSFLCPYARFQSLLIDEHTPVVTYDFTRGEPRGKKAQGDCIDCQFCTRVCPTGIDIRQGLQLECIQCFRCVDACHVIMTNLKRPTGLIRQASILEIKEKKKLKNFKIFSRTGFYGLALLVAVMVFCLRLYNRPALKIQFIRPAHTVYSQLGDGSYANILKMRAVNNTAFPIGLSFEIVLPKEIKFICSGCQEKVAEFGDQSYNITLIIPKEFKNSKEAKLLHKETEIEYTIPLLLPQ